MRRSWFTGALVAASLTLGGPALRAQDAEGGPPAKAGDEEWWTE